MSADRPFVDRPMSDGEVAGRAAAHAVQTWGLQTASLLRTGMNALYACGDVVLRVGHATASAHLGQDLVAVMQAHGVPTVAPIVGLALDVDGVAVTAWERVAATDAPIDWAAVGAAVRLVHEVDPDEIPPGYPVPSPTDFPWWDFESLLAEVSELLDDRSRRGLRAAIARDEGWRTAIRADAVICHGDVHPGNVMVSPTGPLLIDWDLLCSAGPAWDHAMLTTYAERWGGDPAVYPAFAEGYGVDLADDELTRTLAERRNVAATLMRVRAGRKNSAARDEAERRLRYWRGEPDPPVWHAQ
jgi:aminoglycoside phosphotransferase (APT) family kinase protein